MRATQFLAAALLAAAAGMALADDQAYASFGDDRFAAGKDINLSEPVPGDAFIAAGHSRLSGRVEGDLVITGGEVEVRGEVGDDLYVAGGEVWIEALVEGNTRAAGGKVRVVRGAELRGSASIAGGRIEMEGNIGRGLQAFGENILINGQVGSDLRLTGEHLRIGPDARIGGKLTYRSGNEIEIDPQAQIQGGVEREQRMSRDVKEGVRSVVWAVGRALFFFGMVLLGALFVLALPQFSRDSSATIRNRPLASVGLGLAMLVAVPLAAALMMITIIGIPAGLLVLAGYVMLLILGYLVGALFLGDITLARIGEPRASSTGWRILFLLLALVGLSLLRRVPAVGELLVFLIFLAGLGAFSLRTWSGYSGPPPATPAGTSPRPSGDASLRPPAAG